jgi:RimJ/RimL family protein N-acetyltransferase
MHLSSHNAANESAFLIPPTFAAQLRRMDRRRMAYPIETMHPTLEGPNLRLEPLTLAHLPALEDIAFDDRIWRYMRIWVSTPADLRRWLEAAVQRETTFAWAIILKRENRVIGSTSFLDLDTANQTVEIGNTWLSPAHQAAGINPEAKLLQLDYAFDTLQMNRIAFKTHHENLQSQAALRKLGATYEGTFRNHYLMPDGSYRHSVWFSIIREEWPGLRPRIVERVR